MADEFRHKDVGDELTKAEWEAVATHKANGQQANDMLYFNGTYWIRGTPAAIAALLSFANLSDVNVPTLTDKQGIEYNAGTGLWVSTSYMLSKLLTARGDIITRNATVPKRLALGTAGHYLKAGANEPGWAAVVAGLPGATQPINSKGNSFSTIQAAIDDLAGNGWVYAPVATYNEVVLIPDAKVTLFGGGWGTIINGGITGNAVRVTGASCVVRDFTVKTTPGGGSIYDAIYIDANDILIERVFIDGSDRFGILLGTAARIKIIGCYIYNTDGVGIQASFTDPDTLIIANMINTTRDDGIWLRENGENCVVVANRITAWTNEAIDDDSGTSTVVGNDTT